MSKAKFFMGLTREQIIERLTADDARVILAAARDGEFTFLADVIQGHEFVPYNRRTDEELMAEYNDRHDRIVELIEDGALPWDVE